MTCLSWQVALLTRSARMLSEAYDLLRALDAAGMELPSFQRGIATPGKTGPCLRVRLDAAGAITAVEPVTDDDWPAWTHLTGNQSSFPVIRLRQPLLDVDSQEASRLWRSLGFDDDGQRKKGA